MQAESFDVSLELASEVGQPGGVSSRPKLDLDHEVDGSQTEDKVHEVQSLCSQCRIS